MAILNCHSFSKPKILASSTLPNDSQPSTSHLRLKPSQVPPPNAKKHEVKLNRKQGQQQPSILEIERAIGAGIFRDRDIDREVLVDESLADNMVRTSPQRREGSIEKKLRETGEWLIDQTERASRSTGKQILLTMFIWIIPMWMLIFVVASGIIQLPIQIPFIEDLIS